MQNTGSFTFVFKTKEEAEMVANTIKEWSENNLNFHNWTSQLFPVSNNILFVGDDAFMDYFEWDLEIRKLPDIILQKHPKIKFSGEQSFYHSINGAYEKEIFQCNGRNVKYKKVKPNQKNRINIIEQIKFKNNTK